MKTKLMIALLMIISIISFAQNKKNIVTEKIEVSGNCGMCKKTIESSLKLKGVKSASWNVDSKVLTIKYDINKISKAEIEKKIAEAGYDTESVKANDLVYEKLHNCCKYERRTYEK
jgi:mercuric ion binding protein